MILRGMLCAPVIAVVAGAGPATAQFRVEVQSEPNQAPAPPPPPVVQGAAGLLLPAVQKRRELDPATPAAKGITEKGMKKNATPGIAADATASAGAPVAQADADGSAGLLLPAVKKRRDGQAAQPAARRQSGHGGAGGSVSARSDAQVALPEGGAGGSVSTRGYGPAGQPGAQREGGLIVGGHVITRPHSHPSDPPVSAKAIVTTDQGGLPIVRGNAATRKGHNEKGIKRADGTQHD